MHWAEEDRVSREESSVKEWELISAGPEAQERRERDIELLSHAFKTVI